MSSDEERRREWLATQLTETHRLIETLRREPESPKRRLGLEQLAHVQLRIIQLLSEGEPPHAN